MKHSSFLVAASLMICLVLVCGCVCFVMCLHQSTSRSDRSIDPPTCGVGYFLLKQRHKKKKKKKTVAGLSSKDASTATLEPSVPNSRLQNLRGVFILRGIYFVVGNTFAFGDCCD